jgi:uncharacterized membrane protein
VSYPIQLLLGSTKSPFFASQNPFVEKEWHKEERVAAGRKAADNAPPEGQNTPNLEAASSTPIPKAASSTPIPKAASSTPIPKAASSTPIPKAASPTPKSTATISSSPTTEQNNNEKNSVSFGKRVKIWAADQWNNHKTRTCIIVIGITILFATVCYFLMRAPAPQVNVPAPQNPPQPAGAGQPAGGAAGQPAQALNLNVAVADVDGGANQEEEEE